MRKPSGRRDYRHRPTTPEATPTTGTLVERVDDNTLIVRTPARVRDEDFVLIRALCDNITRNPLVDPEAQL